MDPKHCEPSVVSGPYRAPWWLPGGHLQTIYARWLARSYSVAYRRERWDTPDHDFIDLDWVDHALNGAKLIVLFHGLEGYSQSHYARSLMAKANELGWRGVVPHFRGCSGEANRLRAEKSTPLAYRSAGTCSSNGWANMARPLLGSLNGQSPYPRRSI